jgi:hypothetical protein
MSGRLPAQVGGGVRDGGRRGTGDGSRRTERWLRARLRAPRLGVVTQVVSQVTPLTHTNFRVMLPYLSKQK